MKTRGKFIFVLGGARSGKSSIAEKITKKLGENVLYVATAAVLDREMKKRVAAHRIRRPVNWATVEETHKISQVVRENGPHYDAVMVDCLTLLVSNLLLDENYPRKNTDMKSIDKEKAILQEIEKLCQAAWKAKANVIMVSNEVGSGIVPENEISRLYRDIAGWANQIAARYADEVIYTVAGLPLELKELSKNTVEKYNLSEGD